jgi:hypothetical protein
LTIGWSARTSFQAANCRFSLLNRSLFQFETFLREAQAVRVEETIESANSGEIPGLKASWAIVRK